MLRLECLVLILETASLSLSLAKESRDYLLTVPYPY
jgi:hypothetical protein